MGELTEPTRARHVTLAYLCGLTLVLYLDRMCLGKTAPYIQKELRLTDGQMGWVHAAFTIAYGIFELPTGHWGDRYGSRRVLIRIVLWWSAFTALTGAATGFWVLTAIRFLFGAGEAGALPNAARVVDRWFPPAARGRVRGLVHMPALLGGIIAPIGTAYLIEAVGWRWVFAIYGALGAAWAAGFARWFRETPAEHLAVNAAERDLIGLPPVSVPVDHLPLAAILRNRNVRRLCVVLASGSATVYLLFSWYPTYLEKVRGVPNVTSGWLTGCVMFGGAAGCLAGGGLADRARTRLPTRWANSLVGGSGFTLAAVSVAAAALTDPVGWKTIFLAAGCFGVHLHAGPWWGANSAIGGRHSGTTFAVINTAGVFTGALAQVGFGQLPREHWGDAFLLAAALLAVGATCWFLVDPRKTVLTEPRGETP